MAKKAATKSEILSSIAASTALSRKQVASVFEALASEVKASLSKKGPEIFTVPGLMKLTVKNKPATKAHPGKNPFTGEEIMVKAKPASRVVKIRALKSLKDMVK